MRKNSYTNAVDSITAPNRAVEKMLSTARNFERKERNFYMKRFGFKGAIAASLAVVIAVGGIIGVSVFESGRNPAVSENSFIKENSFVITANAEEIGGENSAEVCVPENYGLSVSENADGNVEYRLNFSFECIGENISTVTYSVEKDVIEVVCRKDNNAIVQVETVDQPLFDDEYKNYIENVPESNYTLNRYKSITLDYGNQKIYDGYISIAGVGDDNIKANKDIFFNGGDGSSQGIEAENEWLGKLLGNIVHCTVTFYDGTTQTQDIIIGTKIGVASDTFSEEYSKLPDNIKEEKDFTGVFVTYSLA